VFYIIVAKVDRDVADVAMAIHICFKCIFQMFHLFQGMLQVFLSGFCNGYTHVFNFFLVRCICFRRMLQMFYLNVTKVDGMLHMLNEIHFPQPPAVAGGASSSGQTVLT